MEPTFFRIDQELFGSWRLMSNSICCSTKSIPNPCRNEQSKHTTRRHRKNHSSICAHLWYLLPIIVSPCTTPFPNHPKIRNTTFNTKNLSNFQIFTYVYFSCFFFILLYSLDSPRKLPHAYISSCPLRQIQQMAIVRLAKRAHLLHDVADVVNGSHDLSIS
jgi:hypothetical protein